jgi:hypothetical protein
MLYSPTGGLFVDRDPSIDWSPIVLSENGTYRLVIDGVGETTVNYGFTLRDRVFATAITLGTPIAGSPSVRD